MKWYIDSDEPSPYSSTMIADVSSMTGISTARISMSVIHGLRTHDCRKQWVGSADKEGMLFIPPPPVSYPLLRMVLYLRHTYCHIPSSPF